MTATVAHVLILLIAGTGTGLSARFDSAAACQAARTALEAEIAERSGGRAQTVALCLPADLASQ